MYTVIAAGRAARFNGSTTGGAVEVNYSTAGRQQGVSLAAGKAVTLKSESAASMTAVCLGGNTVLIMVMIVVKYKAYLLVG